MHNLATKKSHELINHPFAFSAIRRRHRALHAMAEMLPEQITFDARERCPRGFDLCRDVDAVPIVLNHLRYATHLAFDPLQRRQRLLRCNLIHKHLLKALDLIPY